MQRLATLSPLLIAVIAACSDDGTTTTGATSSATAGETATTGATTGDTTAGTTATPPTTSATTGTPGTTGDDSTTTGDDSTTGVDPEHVIPLSPTDHLLRISMALRGVRPSLEDLQAVADDPSLIPSKVDAYLEDPRFAETVKDLYAEALLMRALLNPSMLAYRGPLLDLTDADYFAATPEEPLRLIEWVVSDPAKSFAEIVTTDAVFVNEVGAESWLVTGYDQQKGGWQQVAWADDRHKGGGVLSSSALWHRYLSNGNNYNRARANMVSRVFLCDDYLARDVPPFTDVDFSDPAAVQNALQENPGCVGCHQTLDPLASFFWGVSSKGKASTVNAYDMMNQCTKPENCYPLTEYKLDGEDDWENKTGRQAGYFGKPIEDGHLDDLGLQIADDPRFALCTARRFYSYMAQVELDAVPQSLVARLRDDLDVDGRLDIRALARAIVLSDEFKASHTDIEAGADQVVGYKTARPEQLERMFLDLAGFRWEGVRPAPNTFGPFALLNSDGWGYRSMAGGVDGFAVSQPTFTFSPTRILVLQVLAAEAAAFVVDADFALADPEKRALLKLVEETDQTAAAVTPQIARLHARIYGQLLTDDDPEVQRALDLWTAAAGEPRNKWKVLLTAMFQDHRVAFY